jgi:hypothetical protein
LRKYWLQSLGDSVSQLDLPFSWLMNLFKRVRKTHREGNKPTHFPQLIDASLH